MKQTRRKAILMFTRTLLLVVGTAACGQNALKSKAPKSDLELAELDMEAGKYTEAQARLAALLQKEPNNYKALSLLAASLAAQADVIMLDILERAASQAAEQSTGGGTGNSPKLVMQVLPEASLANISLMKSASGHMQSIPEAERSAGMKAQTGLFLTIYSMLRIKRLTENPNELLNMSLEEAAAFVLSLLTDLGAAGSAFGNDTGPFNAAVSSFSQSLQSQQGATDKEKLQASISALSK